MIIYAPGSWIVSEVVSKYGLRSGIYLGSIFNVIAAILRYSSWLIQNPANSNISGQYLPKFGVLVFAQFVGGLAQPFFTNLPARLAGEWFPSNERNFCTAVASMCNPIGIAVGQIMPQLLDTNSDNFGSLLLCQLIIVASIGVLVLIFFKKQPKVPPSIAAASRQTLIARQEDHEVDFAIQTTWVDYKLILLNGQFLKLALGLGLGLGLFNALSTVIEQFVSPSGYSSDDAGLFGGAIIGGGLVGAGIVGYILDTTHAYRTVLRVWVTFALLCTLFLVFVLQPNQYALVLTAFGLMGFAMIPLLPAAFETAVETTYPISEEVSSTVLMTAGNLVGIVLTYAFPPLINLASIYTTVWNPASIFLLSCAVFCGIVFWSFNGEYHRYTAESKHENRQSPGTIQVENE